MAKKVYDIVPPKLAKKIEEDVKDYLKEEKVSVERSKSKRRPAGKVKQRRSIWWPVSIGGVVVLAVFGIFLFFKLQKASVEIWPKIETLSFRQAIAADVSANFTDIEQNVVSAKKFEISKTLSENFPATGNASDEGNASGIITIYNKYDPPQAITFRAGTHFLSDSGKLFKAEDRVVIPAAKKSGGKITPGSVDVKVEAEEGGDSYNISASNFSVPGLKGTAFYYSVYASSESAMTGGYAGDIKKVTDADIQSAEDSVTEKLISQALDELRSQAGEDYVLLEGAASSEVTEVGTVTKSGTVTDSFTYEATINFSVLGFKKSDLDEFAKKYIISHMPENKTLLESSLTSDYSVESVDISDGAMQLNFSFSAGTYQNVDKNAITLELEGKTASQINSTIGGIMGDELDKTKIDFWPFWVTKAPKNQKSIKVELKFD